MAAMGVVERAPFDPMIFGDVKHPPTWMWCLTEEGKTHRFRTVTRVLPPVRRPVREKLDAGAMDRMLTVMEGRNPMLSATIAREMGCADSYMISGILRRACKEGRVERTVRHGAAYFSLKRR